MLLPELLAAAGETTAQTPAVDIRCVAGFSDASSVSLVFAEDLRAMQQAAKCDAGAILAQVGLESEDRRIVRVQHPKLIFARCAEVLRRLSSTAIIDPAATIHATAVLGANCSVGPGSVIEAGAVLGDDVVIGPRAVIAQNAVVGSKCVIQAGAVIGATGFGYVRDEATGEYILFPQQGRVVLEERVEVGANTTIDRGALGETRIGAGTKIDNLVHIGHNCRIGRNVIIAAQVGVSGSCVIGDGAVLAGQVGISDHCTIGPGVVLGGQAGVYMGKTVQGPGEVFAGTPAEPLKDHLRGLAKVRRL